MRAKYPKLLSDKNLKRWFDNVSRGSELTANLYLRRLASFCEQHNETTQSLLKLKPRRIYELLLDTISEMEKAQYGGSYIQSIVRALKSWLKFNHKPFIGSIKVKGTQETPTLRDERVPTRQELHSIFLAGDEKARVVCSLLAHSGLRPAVLGTFHGTDGLRVGDLPELELHDREVVFAQTPTLVRVRPMLSKAHHEYFTFLGEEGCQYLKAYLELRMRNGHSITADSPIITPKIFAGGFMSSISISETARRAMRKTGFSWRPYVLRSYFATQLMLAESKGLIIRDYRTFFMGHKGDIEAVYTLNKRKLPPDVVEEMRESYAKALKYLQTIEAEKPEDVTKMFKRQLRLVAGFKAEEITDEQLNLGDDEFQRLVREKLVSQLKNNGVRQKVVAVPDVEQHLADGWEFVAALPNKRAILKLPLLA